MIIIILNTLIDMKNNTNKNTFTTHQENYNNDGNMTFDFLSSENTTNVLEKYYLNDDIKINGTRVNYHKYQTRKQTNGFNPYIYGEPESHRQRSPNRWNRYDNFAHDIYNTYRFRR